jgi:hypothetical protein
MSYKIVLLAVHSTLSTLSALEMAHAPTHYTTDGRPKSGTAARSLAVRQRSAFTRARPLPRNRAANSDHKFQRHTHFGIQLAVNAIWNLTENLRYMLHLHREQQRAIRRQHEKSLSQALSERRTEQPKIVPIHAPARSNGKTTNSTRAHSTRERFAKRRRSSSYHAA